MQPTVICVAKAAPAVNSLMVCVGPLVDMEDDHPFHGGNGNMKTEKRTRSDSISDHTDSDRMTRQTTKKLRASPEGRPETSVLTDAVWKKMQSMIRATKNLRNITRVTLAFFREHELAQMRMLGLDRPVYPIVVPVAEAYNILSFRKRRVYDVLHVLEGAGVLKRIQDKHSEVSRFRGGQFMYFGRDGAKQRLESIYKRAQGISKDATTLYPDATQRNVDTVLLAACNAQAAVESWPHLAATTVSFLSFVLASDTNDTNSLGLLNRRLVDARIACNGSIPEAGRDGLIAETNRRVYDVVSVLASLNIVILKSLSEELKKESGRRVGYATPRRGVVFNAAIFSDSSLIRVGNSCASHLASALAKEEAKFPAAKNVDESEVTDEASQGSCIGGDAALVPLLHELDVPDMEDLFPGIEPSECTDTSGEWWDVPLRDLLLRDALPPVDFLDWEIMQAISRSRLRSADDKAPFDTSKECDSHLDDEAELECHEQLDAA